jgi:hypothetical protein
MWTLTPVMQTRLVLHNVRYKTLAAIIDLISGAPCLPLAMAGKQCSHRRPTTLLCIQSDPANVRVRRLIAEFIDQQIDQIIGQ